MHSNPQLHQYFQQSPLSGTTSNNPLAAVLQGASQHYSSNQGRVDSFATYGGHLPLMGQPQDPPVGQVDEEKIYALILDLLNPMFREQALLDLSKKREQYEDLALVLWYSYGKYIIAKKKALTQSYSTCF
jgi:hypothetical protein